MKAKHLIALALACILSLSAFAGCASTDSPSSPSSQPGSTSSDPNESTPAVNEHTTLNLRITTDVTSLDPHVTTANEEYSIFTQIFDGLVRFDG